MWIINYIVQIHNLVTACKYTSNNTSDINSLEKDGVIYVSDQKKEKAQ